MSNCALPNREPSPTSRVISFLIVAVLALQHLLIISPITAKAAVSTTVVISEFRVRGPSGGNDEFIELYNLTDAPINIGGWKINGSNNTAGTSTRLTITSGATIPARGHYLVTNAATGGYSGAVTGNQTYTVGVTDDGGIALLDASNSIIDQVGMNAGSAYKEGTTLSSLGSSNLDRCYERKPGSTAGNAQDTDNNLADFQLITPCNPQNLASPPTPSTTPTPTPSPTATPSPTPTNPTAVGNANPNSVQTGNSTLLTVTVTPGTNPGSTSISVTGDLSAIGGSATQTFFNDGTNGDVTAGDNIFSFTASVPSGTSEGSKSLPISVQDAEARSASTSILLTVVPPPPPLDHIVISQIYGGGGNGGATYKNDFVELYNPTTAAVDVGGWTIQYGSATGDTWQAQPLGGVIQPGEYYLVSLATNGNIGADLPAANISGSINMSGSNGKVALVNNGDPLEGCVTNGPVVDLVGYGTANCREGATNVATLSNSTAAIRKNSGATDTNVNGADFVTGTPSPRRTAAIVEIGPYVLTTDPRANASTTPRDASVNVTFTEPVTVDADWFSISCAVTGTHNNVTIASSAGGRTFTITPNVNFQAGEQCTATVFKNAVHDVDTDDVEPGTDTLKADKSVTFAVATGAPPPYGPEVHLKMGNPSDAVADINFPDNYLMEKPEFALSYNRDRGTPNWVSWHLSDEWIGNLTRVDTFRPDPAVPPDWYRVQATDYQNTGFDRGHMTPNADRDPGSSIPINQATFLMSNMVPQAPDNNQGPWAVLENDLRDLYLPMNELYIVSGPAGIGGSSASSGTITNTIAGGHVTVPKFTWKVALIIPKDSGDDISRVSASTRTLAVIMPNVQGIRNNDWRTYLTTVDAVEQLTGYDFFANLPDAVENSVEAGVDGTNPPGTADQFVQVNEDGEVSFMLNAVNPTSSILTATTSQPAYGSVTCDKISCKYSPESNFNGQDSFTFSVSNGTLTSNTSTVTITVSAVNDAPTFTATTPASQTVDYLDEIQPINITVADADDSADSLVVTQSGLPSGLTLAETSPGQWTITGKPDVVEGTYTVNLTVADPSTASSPTTVTINVAKEKADIVYTGDEDIMTAGPSITSATVRLSARLTQQVDGFSGDISKARVTFELFKSTNSGLSPDIVYSGVEVNADGDAFNSVTLPADIYNINVKIDAANTYWVHSAVELAILNITVPTTEQRSTGGGWVNDSGSSNGKAHFGFSVTAGKNSTSAPKGNLSFFFKGLDGYLYRAKANSWQGGYLQFSAEPGTDVYARSNFKGSCNVQKIDPVTGLVVESSGNFIFEVSTKDGGQLVSDQPDAFAIVVKDKNGITWHQIGASSSLVDLGGGNITNKPR